MFSIAAAYVMLCAIFQKGTALYFEDDDEDVSDAVRIRT